MSRQACSTVRRRRCSIASAVPIAAVLVPVTGGLGRAETRLEGEYVFIVDVRKQDRFYDWSFDSNNDDTFNQIEFRALSNPFTSVEAFMKTGAEWNRGGNSNSRPRFQLREAHVKVRREFGSKGIESFLFSRQNRFWVDNQLIRVVQDAGGGNGQGVRVDTWGWLDVHTAVIYSDFSGVCLGQGRSPFGATSCDSVQSASTDDAYIARIWRPFLADKLRLGATYNRKTEREQADRVQDLQHTQVFGFDARLTLRDVDYRFELARGRENTLDGRIADGSVVAGAKDWQLSRLRLTDLQAAFPDDVVLRGEVRALRFGTARIGYFNVAPSFWLLGPQFRNQLGDGNNDEKGFALNSWYLLPRRAITLSTNYVEYEKEVFQQRRVTEFYEEMLTEYVNGFTSKFSFRRRRTRDTNPDTGVITVTRNDDLFGEMVVENSLAWLRVQGFIKDLDTPFKKDILAIETAVNLTRTLKVYNRFGFGNDPARQRKVLFSELQYRPTNNVELFLAYGPFWIGGGSNPALEGNLVSNGDQRDLLRLTLKGNF